MDYAPLEDASATLIIMAQTVKIVNLSISWTVATFAHSTKVPAIQHQWWKIQDILAVHAQQVILVYTVPFLYVLVTAAIVENVLLQTLVNASEEKWDLTVKQIADAEVTESAIQIKLASAIKASSLTPLLKNVSFLVMV